jgi:hypothetical protein
VIEGGGAGEEAVQCEAALTGFGEGGLEVGAVGKATVEDDTEKPVLHCPRHAFIVEEYIVARFVFAGAFEMNVCTFVCVDLNFPPVGPPVDFIQVIV